MSVCVVCVFGYVYICVYVYMCICVWVFVINIFIYKIFYNKFIKGWRDGLFIKSIV